MRKWVAKQAKDPSKRCPLPPAGDEFLEMEAAHDWGIAWDDWMLKHPITRAKMLSMYLHKAQREAFINDWSMNSAKTKAKGKDDGYDRMMKTMH